jgi:hypothetical protein
MSGKLVTLHQNVKKNDEKVGSGGMKSKFSLMQMVSHSVNNCSIPNTPCDKHNPGNKFVNN